MAAKSNFKNMVLCLTVTCLVCSSLLAGVYALTAGPIAKTNEALLKQTILKVVPEGDISGAMPLEVGGKPSEYYTSSKEGNVIAYAVKSSVVGFGGPLVLMVGVLPDGTVYSTDVYQHSETPGLGAKCQTDAAFYNQFRNFNPAVKKLSVKKDGGDIDAITASTITSRAYTTAVANALDAVNGLIGKQVDHVSGASVHDGRNNPESKSEENQL